MRTLIGFLGFGCFLGVLVGLASQVQPIVVFSGEGGEAEALALSWPLIAGLFVGGWVCLWIAGSGEEDEDTGD